MNNETYYVFFEDGTSITKSTLEGAISVPYKQYIIRETLSPISTDKYRSHNHRILDSEGKEIRLRFGDWELIDIPHDNTGFNVFDKLLTFYCHKDRRTYKRLYKGRFLYYFYKDVVGFMKRMSSEAGWQIYEFEKTIAELNEELKKKNEEINKLHQQIENASRLENDK